MRQIRDSTERFPMKVKELKTTLIYRSGEGEVEIQPEKDEIEQDQRPHDENYPTEARMRQKEKEKRTEEEGRGVLQGRGLSSNEMAKRVLYKTNQIDVREGITQETVLNMNFY